MHSKHNWKYTKLSVCAHLKNETKVISVAKQARDAVIKSETWTLMKPSCFWAQNSDRWYKNFEIQNREQENLENEKKRKERKRNRLLNININFNVRCSLYFESSSLPIKLTQKYGPSFDNRTKDRKYQITESLVRFFLLFSFRAYDG